MFINPAWILISLKEDDVWNLQTKPGSDYYNYCLEIPLKEENFVEGQWIISDNEMNHIPEHARNEVKNHFQVFVEIRNSGKRGATPIGPATRDWKATKGRRMRGRRNTRGRGN